MTIKTHAWDAADYLDSDASISAYLDAAFEDGDPKLITAALGDIALSPWDGRPRVPDGPVA